MNKIITFRRQGNQLVVIATLQVALVILKLTDVMRWSWWLVFSPFLALALALVIRIIVLAVSDEEDGDE